MEQAYPVFWVQVKVYLWKFSNISLDLILKCTENRTYYSKDGSLQEKENSNTFYLPNVSCIKKKHPEFQFTDVCLDDATRSTFISFPF